MSVFCGTVSGHRLACDWLLASLREAHSESDSESRPNPGHIMVDEKGSLAQPSVCYQYR